jgi:hypothetical protein
VQQLNGADPVVDKLTNTAYMKAKFPNHDDDVKDGIRALLTTELRTKIKFVETLENPAPARPGED